MFYLFWNLIKFFFLVSPLLLRLVQGQKFGMAKGKRLKGTPLAQGATTITPAPAAPGWPQFKPQLPVTDLVPETVVPDKVVVYRSFFPRSLCRDYVEFVRHLPLTVTPAVPKRGHALRVNDRFQVDDATFADRLWTETGLKEAVLQPELAHLWCVFLFYLFIYSRSLYLLTKKFNHRGGEVIGLNPNIRIYRYQKGHFFDAHCMSELPSLLWCPGRPSNSGSPLCLPTLPPIHPVCILHASS